MSKVYVDMDGTLCRFHDTEHKYIEAMWERGFYSSLKPFEEFLNGLSVCIDRNPNTEFYILSAVLDTEPPFIEDEKREWLHRYLPQLADDHMIFVPAGKNKSEFIGGISADCCLIDDYNVNLTDWQNAGGTAVKFVNDVNDRGLGAYGGEKGQLWSGLRISHEQNAMEICLQIEWYARIERTGEKAYSRYGFEGDVLPFEFAGEIIPYFEMRIQMDQDWLQQKAAEGETFESYSVVSGKDQHDILQSEPVRQYMANRQVDQALAACLEECYNSCRLYGINTQRAASWITASIRHDHMWRTYPVTPTNVRMYITSMVERDQRLTDLAQHINRLTVSLKSMERQLYMPSSKDVTDNFLLNGQKSAFLEAACNRTKHKLNDLKSEWKDTARADYPLFAYGGSSRRFSSYIKNQHTRTK